MSALLQDLKFWGVTDDTTRLSLFLYSYYTVRHKKCQAYFQYSKVCAIIFASGRRGSASLWEVMHMTLYEVLSLAIAALTLIVSIISALFNR